MQLLQREYLNSRLQHYFNELKIPQTRKRLTHQALIDALKANGAIQETEAPEEDNIFHWPFSLNGDENDPLFLTHCNIRFFYFYKGTNWKKRELCFTMGLFSTFCCKKEKPDALADEIIKIDTLLIPQWIEDFNNLHPLEITELAIKQFYEQAQPLRDSPIVLDSYVAKVYGVSVTEVRQTISRNKNLFKDYAFHLTWEEYKAWNKKVLNAPKIHKSDYLPYAITHHAFCLLSMQLRSDIAIKVNMGIIETVTAKVPLTELLKQFHKISKEEQQ